MILKSYRLEYSIPPPPTVTLMNVTHVYNYVITQCYISTCPIVHKNTMHTLKCYFIF